LTKKAKLFLLGLYRNKTKTLTNFNKILTKTETKTWHPLETLTKKVKHFLFQKLNLTKKAKLFLFQILFLSQVFLSGFFLLSIFCFKSLRPDKKWKIFFVRSAFNFCFILQILKVQQRWVKGCTKTETKEVWQKKRSFFCFKFCNFRKGFLLSQFCFRFLSLSWFCKSYKNINKF